MKVHRCRICGETYLGEEAPDKCPFCGVDKLYLISGSDWTDENAGLELTDITQKNLKDALELEVGNSRFYLCAAGKAKGTDNELEGMFKQLAKVEREHASVISKMLKVALPDIINTPLDCAVDGPDNIDESSKRETNAIEHYTKFLKEATEKRAQIVFAALVAVERTHLALDEVEKNRINTAEAEK